MTNSVSNDYYSRILAEYTSQNEDVSGVSGFAQILSSQMSQAASPYSGIESGDNLLGGSSFDPASMVMMLGDDAGIKDALVLLCSMLSMGAASSTGSAQLILSIASALKEKPDGTIADLKSYLLTGGFSSSVVNTAFSYAGEDDPNYPYAASKAVTPLVTSSPDERSPETYRAVIDQFNVASNPRYMVNKKGNNDTYCNIFMWDVTLAMGAEIPHYVDPDTGDTRQYPDVEGAVELTANAIYDWLSENGERYGWKSVTAQEAQALANEGNPVVTAWKNSGGHGHVQVVCPSQDLVYNEERGVTVAQAGSKLLNYASIKDVFGGSALSRVVYYAHD